jgi:hypothetical protein
LLAVITLNRDGVGRVHRLGSSGTEEAYACLKLRNTYVAARERLAVLRVDGITPLLLHGFYDKYGCCLEGTFRHEISAMISNMEC